VKPNLPLLWRHPDIKGGQVCIRGTGIIARYVADCFAGGDSIEALVDDYDVEPEAIRQCIRLMLFGCHGRNGLLAGVERRMEALVPLETRS
jgi:uncharacterized protein (DUF433 family)